MFLCTCVYVCVCGLSYMCGPCTKKKKADENLLGLTLKFNNLLIDCKVGQFPHTHTHAQKQQHSQTHFIWMMLLDWGHTFACTNTAQ